MSDQSESIFNTNSWWGQVFAMRWVRHLIYWSSIVVFFGFFWGSSVGNYKEIILSEILLLPGKMAAVYFCIDFLLPRYLLSRRFSHFILLSLAAMLLLGLFQRILVYFILIERVDGFLDLPFHNPYEIMHHIIDINTVMVIPLGVRLLRVYYYQKVAATELAKARYQAELKFLKAQVHPHFLFNTLNTLYGLILKKSDQAGEVVLKLSDLMRYLLYETQAERVPLEKEIEHIRNYIELEKIRYGQKLEVSFTLNGEVSGKFIAPMILLHFVENSFKHGVAKSIDCAWITIDFTSANNCYLLRIENSKPTNKSDLLKSKKPFSGVGLQNVTQRLNLLYKDKHRLTLDDQPDSYTVELELIHDND
ncbi:MAG: histidine kinase [Bacteroidota bacterium]|nr:MAG: histidine kinase [Bacteroidota bacterium]